MSEYPDRVFLDALNEASAKGIKRFASKVRGCFKNIKLGDLTMVFSMEDGGIPLLSSVYVPWLLVWESLVGRMKRCSVRRGGTYNGAFEPDELETPQYGLGLSDLDEAICRLTSENGSRRPILSISCGPCFDYTIQLLLCYGGLSVIVRAKNVDVTSRYDIGWTLAETAMIGHYVAARLGVPADRLIFSACDPFIPKRSTTGKKEIGVTAFIRQPSVCFGRVAKSARDCASGDLFIMGYMRVSKSVFNINGVCATSNTNIKRAMSVGADAAISKWRTNNKSRSTNALNQNAVFF